MQAHISELHCQLMRKHTSVWVIKINKITQCGTDLLSIGTDPIGASQRVTLSILYRDSIITVVFLINFGS